MDNPVARLDSYLIVATRYNPDVNLVWILKFVSKSGISFTRLPFITYYEVYLLRDFYSYYLFFLRKSFFNSNFACVLLEMEKTLLGLLEDDSVLIRLASRNSFACKAKMIRVI